MQGWQFEKRFAPTVWAYSFEMRSCFLLEIDGLYLLHFNPKRINLK